jgi:hypothetical protein
MKKKIKFNLGRYQQGGCEVVDEIGNKVRIFATDFKYHDELLIIGATTIADDFEIERLWHRDGTELEGIDNCNLCLLIEDNDFDFKPFDKVLVRDYDEDEWECDFFKSYSGIKTAPFCCFTNSWRQCIPYEGHETLIGTTNLAF